MRAKSKWHGLDYFVQCCWPGKHHFETIAAFGFGSVATDYAKEVLARQCVPGFRWRVVHYKNNEPTCVWRSDADKVDIITDPKTGLKFEITRYVPPANPVKLDPICGSKPLK